MKRGIVLPHNEFLDSAFTQIRRDSSSAARRRDSERVPSDAHGSAVINRMQSRFGRRRELGVASIQVFDHAIGGKPPMNETAGDIPLPALLLAAARRTVAAGYRVKSLVQ